MPRLSGRSRRAVLALAALASLSTVRTARADVVTKASCVEADTNAQNERRAQHFHAARELLQLCSNPACPKLVHDDCEQRLNDLEGVNPTVVFAAKDAKGDDVIGVRVTMDGIALATELAGAPLPVDPGPHTFTFSTPGAADVQRKLVIHEGEKDRQERVVFSDLHGAGRVASSGPRSPKQSDSQPPTDTSSPGHGQKTAAIVAGSVGAVGILVGAVTGILSFSKWSSSKSACNTGSCTDHAGAIADHDSAATDATISDLGFIAGGVLVAGGVVLYVTAPSSGSSASGSAFRIVPSVGRDGAGLQLEGRF